MLLLVKKTQAQVQMNNAQPPMNKHVQAKVINIMMSSIRLQLAH